MAEACFKAEAFKTSLKAAVYIVYMAIEPFLPVLTGQVRSGSACTQTCTPAVSSVLNVLLSELSCTANMCFPWFR